MSEYFIDYSAKQLNGSVIASTAVGPAGERPTGVIRYVTAPGLRNPPGGNQKHITPAEYASLRAAGLKIRYFYQDTTSDPDGGFARGARNAQRALDGLNELGSQELVHFCNDRTTVPNVALWQQYLDGAASVLGPNRVGAYGFFNALNAARGHAVSFVQAGRRSDLVSFANYWQDNNVQPTVGGIKVDRLLVISDHSAQSSGGGGSTPGAPTVPTEEDSDMFPMLLPASPDTQYTTVPWNGKAATLNVIATSDDVFIANPQCWTPSGGTGDVPRGGNWQQVDRVAVNEPGIWDIPAGVTRIFLATSSNGSCYVWPVAK